MRNLLQFRKLLLTTLFLLVSFSSFAYDFEVDGIFYNKLSENTVEVTYEEKYKKTESYTDAMTIPSSITANNKKYNVTSIGEYAFYKCTNLVSLKVPDGVTSIGRRAFSDCSGLASINIPDGVTSIGMSAFSDCSGLASINIPESVTSIGESAFSQCEGLTAVYITDLKAWCNIVFGKQNKDLWDTDDSSCNPLDYAHNLFLNNELLRSITIPAGVTSIKDNAFCGCSISSINIPDGVTSIGEYAFWSCSSLTSVKISDAVTSIGKWAFCGCHSLTSINIPDRVTSIEDRTFGSCVGLTSIKIPDGVTSIGYEAFENCTGLTSINIPDEVTYIGKNAFYNCSSLTSINIPDGVTSIKDYTFYGCSGLTSINISDGITSIGDYAFYKCTNLVSFKIPNGVSSIGKYAFYDCNGLTSIVIPDEVTSIEESTFESCSGLTTVTIGKKVTSIGALAFFNCGKLKSINIPDGITSIGNYAFESCGNNMKINISSIEVWMNFTNEYGQACFHDYSLIVNGVVLTNLVVPENITTINMYAFSDCTGLESITFHKDVTTIVQNAFKGCKNVKKIFFQGEVPPAVGTKALDGISRTNCIIFVPKGCVDTYKSTSPWSEFSNIFEDGTPILSLSYTEAEIKVNEILQLTANSLIGGTISWNSSDESVAVVSSNGLVTPKKSGNVVITATASDGSTATCSITISKVVQTITWEQSFEDVEVGNEIALTATASSGLSVEYVITQGSENAEIVGDTLMCKVAGDVTIEARQAGNDGYEAAESVSKTISISEAVVVKKQQTITWNQSFGEVKVGDEIALTATSSSGLSIEYIISQGSEYAEIVGDTLICKVAGGVTIEARQAGNDEYEAAESVSKTISINKKSQQITWDQSLEDVHVGDEITLTATASSGLSVEYVITQSSEFAEISDGKLICKAAGDVTIAARQTGNDEYEAAESVSKTISINKKSQQITWEQSFEEVKVGDEIALTATSSSGLSIEYIISQGSEFVEISDGKLICKAAGNVTIAARQTGNDEYEAAESVSKTISISDVTRNIPITIDGITYDYCEDNNKELQVISNTAEIAVIKSEVEGLPVTTINRPAFYHDLNVKEVHIPACVTDIKDLSFEQNYNLTTISVDADNPNYCDVDGVLYSKDKKTLVTFPAGKATSYTVIDGTTAVGDHAFSCNDHLERVTIPEGVTSIGFDAFFQCYGLRDFVIPSTVISLDFGVLRDCSNLEGIHSLINNPSRVSMGDRVFEDIDKDKCILYVPIGTKSLYEVADQWKDFKNIVEEEYSGIEEVLADGISFIVRNHYLIIRNAPANSHIRIYTVAGQLVYSGQETTIQLSAANTYIVEVNGYVRKLKIK